MFERFAGDARRTVMVALEEARAAGSREIDPRHLILAVLLAGEGPSKTALEDAGFTVDQVRADIRGDAAAGSDATGSSATGSNAAGSDATGKGPESAATVLGTEDADALRAIGIDLDAVRESIEAQFGPDALSGAAEDDPAGEDVAGDHPAGDDLHGGEASDCRQEDGRPGPHPGRGRRRGARRDDGPWRDGPWGDGPWGDNPWAQRGEPGRGDDPWHRGGGAGGFAGRGRGGHGRRGGGRDGGRRGGWGHPRFDAEAKRAMHLGVRHAVHARSPEITSTHLLLGVLTGASGPTKHLVESKSTVKELKAQILAQAGQAA